MKGKVVTNADVHLHEPGQLANDAAGEGDGLAAGTGNDGGDGSGQGRGRRLDGRGIVDDAFKFSAAGDKYSHHLAGLRPVCLRVE